MRKLADPQLIEDIKENHLDDFFAWLLEGSKRYYSEGLNPPACVLETKRQAICEFDMLQLFLNEKTETKRGSKIKTKDLYERFGEWFDDNIGNDDTNFRFPSIRQFNSSLRTKGLNIDKNNSIQYVFDISI